jgi:dTDP-4-dehydrorhamnose 3,5-epimerase
MNSDQSLAHAVRNQSRGNKIRLSHDCSPEFSVEQFEVTRATRSATLSNTMRVTPLELPGLALINLTIHKDARGFFVERYQTDRLKEAGLTAQFIQDNHSRSLPRVLRGLHYQRSPAQGKLVSVVRGRIWDVVVDIRAGSDTFGKTFAIELSDDNGLALWVPAGFAHGFCVLGEEPADVLYKVDAPYNAAGEGGIHWADSDLAIAWPIERPIVSPRDDQLGSFADYQRNR